MTVNKTREQHYVPKFLLSQFAQVKGKIDAYQFKKDRLRTGVKLKTQCKERDYYGKDGIIEDSFQKLESPVAEVIKKIIDGQFDAIKPADLTHLRHFILYQSARTKVSAREAGAFLEAGMKGVFKTAPARNKFEQELGDRFDISELDSLKIDFSDTKLLALRAAVTAIPAIFDLHLKLLVSKGDVEFVISDGPVVRCNQFAEFHTRFCGQGGTRGFAVKGIQIFMPISPVLCLVLYDSGTYSCGSPNRFVVNTSKRDCILLNSLQALHADEFIYRSPTGPKIDELREYVKFRQQQLSSFVHKVELSEEYNAGPGQAGQLIKTATPDVFSFKKFSFMEVLELDSVDHFAAIPVRSHELVKNLNEWRKAIEKRKDSNK